MTKLLRLGASGSYAKSLDGQLHDMKHPDLDASAAVPRQVVKDADTWAQQTYTDYFAGNYPIACLAVWIEPAILLAAARHDRHRLEQSLR